MRHLFLIGFLLCSGPIAAQTDDRQVRTVHIDDGQVRTGQDDAPRVQKPVRVPRSNVRPPRGPQRAAPPPERPGTEAQSDERHVLARRLVALSAEGGGGSEPVASCIPDTETMQADILAAYRANPADFHGISPQSAYWRDVELAWHDYYVDRCAAQNGASPAAIVAQSYAANLSADDLRQLVAFQESPLGRAFIAATERARQDLERVKAGPPQGNTDDAEARYLSTMLRLKAKYERAPK
ncbi:MAG: DUF2059 domain-containing protein [Pseudomonadota bacterium]|nr:DUF2059 domain-containing protein [Pseudomonadota bacterium]